MYADINLGSVSMSYCSVCTLNYYKSLFSVGSISVTDPNNFLLPMAIGRRKRQMENFEQTLFEDLVITDTHRELCGENRDCLFDFAATNDTNLAMNTLQFTDDTGDIQTMLGDVIITYCFHCSSLLLPGVLLALIH